MLINKKEALLAIKSAITGAINESRSRPNNKFNMNIIFVHALDKDALHTVQDFKYNSELDYNYIRETGKIGAEKYVKSYEIYDSGLIYTSGLTDSELAKTISSARFRYVFYDLLKRCEIELTDEFNPANVKKLLSFINKSQN